ncbi:hypothetical protein OIU76_006352 [Salix suchowensis]|nr:hypothetical protein OIU76_006352 [Salix suchowensis]
MCRKEGTQPGGWKHMVDQKKVITSHQIEAPCEHTALGGEAVRSRGVRFKGDAVKAVNTSGIKLLVPVTSK